MNKKKLAFIDLTNFKDWPMGGMLQYELNILPYLCEHYDVDIWGVSVDGKINDSLCINKKIYKIHIWTDVKTHKRIIPNFWRGLFLKKYINDFKNYDAIYAHTATCLIPFFNSGLKAKLIYQQHGLIYLNDKILKTKIQVPFMKRAQKQSDLVFIVSGPKLVKKYSNTMKEHGKFVAIDSPVNTVDVGLKKNQRNVKNRFIYTGRVTTFKGVDFLVNAFREYLNAIDQNAHLTIVGDGSLLTSLRQKINNEGLDNKIQITGKLDHKHISEILVENNIFVTASKGEGVSVSVAEANTLGLPVVCFNVFGLDEQVKDNVNGMKAKSQDINSFVSAMEYVSNHYNRLSVSSLKYSQKYSSKKISEKIISNIDKELSK